MYRAFKPTAPVGLGFLACEFLEMCIGYNHIRNHFLSELGPLHQVLL